MQPTAEFQETKVKYEKVGQNLSFLKLITYLVFTYISVIKYIQFPLIMKKINWLVRFCLDFQASIKSHLEFPVSSRFLNDYFRM